jgi:hypothetical protein
MSSSTIRRCAGILFTLLFSAGSVTAADRAVVVSDAAHPPIQFAAAEVRAALNARGFTTTTADAGAVADQTAALQVVITTVAAALPGQPSVQGVGPQGFAMRRTADGGRSRWWVIGGGAPGAMYGGLELAETIRISGHLTAVEDRVVNPHIARRGIKFNIPLDARTPSYSDDSSSAQANIAEMWSMAFWTRFLDEMARHRYNLLSLWSLSPFPSLVKVLEYPKVALTDVKKKRGGLWDATLQGRNMYDPRWELETVKTLTIDDKIAFWRAVMEHARDRGIDVAIFTWNTFVYGTEHAGYGITDSLENPTTKDYVRRSVRTLFNTYPLLTAIGITSGENMGDENSGTTAKERWLWETYGLGVADAMADARNPHSPFHRPGRRIHLIHRAHQSNLGDIVSFFGKLPGYDDPEPSLSFSFKYSQAHMHSTTKPLFIHQNGWFDTIPPGKQTWLTVRNDDMYYMRWGDPDFARAYLTSLPDLRKIAGFYMGPDGYTWGREFVSTEPDSPRQLVIEKMRYSFLIWGRLAFEPSLPNTRFEAILGSRFPQVPAGDFYSAWASVSKILPLMTRFYWGSLDFRWYPEACWSRDGFATVQDLIDPKYEPMRADEDGQTPRIMSVKAYVDGEAPGGRLTPLDVADMLQRHADAALQRADRLVAGDDKELRLTLGDIRAMAWLGRYYAEKIRGAVDLYRHQKAGNARDHQNARTHLQLASSHWRQYAALWSAQYVGQVLTRMGPAVVDVAAIQTFVDRDVPAPIPAR